MPVKEREKNETKGQIDECTLDRIMEQYDLITPSILPIVQLNGELVVLNNHSETTFKAIIKSEQEKYILKQVPWYCSSREFTEFMIYFQENLFKVGFSVPEVIRSKKNSYVEINGDFFYLQKFISADTYNGSEIQTFNAGKSLGELHLVSQAMKLSKKYVKNKENVFDIATNMLTILNSLLENNQDYFDVEAVKNGKLFCLNSTNQLEDVKNKNLCIYDESRIIVHGDYNPLNMLFGKDDKVKATFDFDNCSIDNPIHDVAEGLLDFSFNKYRSCSTRFSQIPTTFNYVKAEAFLEGYKISNKKMYSKISPLLSIVTSAVCTELLTLGIVRGDYDVNMINIFPKIIDEVEKTTNELSRKIK